MVIARDCVVGLSKVVIARDSIVGQPRVELVPSPVVWGTGSVFCSQYWLKLCAACPCLSVEE